MPDSPREGQVHHRGTETTEGAQRGGRFESALPASTLRHSVPRSSVKTNAPPHGTRAAGRDWAPSPPPWLTATVYGDDATTPDPLSILGALCAAVVNPARHLFLLALSACVDPPPEEDPPIDLVTPLGAGAVRAGVISDEAATIGGVMGESRAGDVLLVNDRARFVVHGADRRSMGLVGDPGGLLDADVVRGPGEADLDLVVDALPFLDVGWYALGERVEVVADGLDGGEAIVEVAGVDQGFAYLSSVFENDVPAGRGLEVVTRYALGPDTPLLRVETVVTAGADEVTLRPGDILQTVPGITSFWLPGIGRSITPGGGEDAVMVVHHATGLTLGMFADDRDGSAAPSSGLDLLSFLISLPSLYEAPVSIAAGGTASWSRWWGVAEQPARLTDAWLAALGEPTDRIEATVVGPEGPVAGVWVTVEVDGAPFTLAITDDHGRVTADVPAGADVHLVADGGGDRQMHDLSADVASPLASSFRREAALEHARAGLTPTPHARGWGRAEGPPGVLTLPEPGRITLVSPTTPRFAVRLRALDGPVRDDAYAIPPLEGLAAVGHAHTGRLTLPVEPGRYALMAWHGVRWETHEQEVFVEAGETVEIPLDGLQPGPAVDGAPGWFTGDTHIHAAPSFDGKISPAQRALTAAATGLDLWFASEHDVRVGHADLVDALGLGDAVHVVGSEEVTPWVRGHVNLFPTTVDPDTRAGGAWAWWEDLRSTTAEQFEILTDREPDALVQINHPFSPGLPSLAGWSPGEIANPSLWWDGFDALEVVVPGQDPRGLTLYADLSARGILSAATGSSDSHDALQNDPGLLHTWIHVPSAASVADLTDDAVADAFRARHTLASNGPFALLDPLPGETIPSGTVLTIQALGPSWIRPDRVVLHRGGVPGDPIPLDEDGHAELLLTSDRDTSIVVELLGDTPMQPLTGRTPWLVASAYQLDAEGDGWQAPLPPYE